MMKTKSSARSARLPQRQRASSDALPTFRLTKRDGEVIRAVYEYGALTPKQISDLLFAPIAEPQLSPPSSRCLHRLKLLYHYGFLFRHEQRHTMAEGRRPFVYRLDRAGAEYLLNTQEDGDFHSWRPGKDNSPMFLDHLLASNDVRISIVRAAARHGFQIETWLDEHTLKSAQNKHTVFLAGASGKKKRASVVADGYFHLSTSRHHYHQFVETDLRTVTGASKDWTARTWARKVAAYIEYYRSGKYQERYHTRSLRILTVTTGQTRLTNLKEITRKAGGKSRFWFTTFKRIAESDVLEDSIWEKASEDGLFSLVW